MSRVENKTQPADIITYLQPLRVENETTNIQINLVLLELKR